MIILTSALRLYPVALQAFKDFDPELSALEIQSQQLNLIKNSWRYF